MHTNVYINVDTEDTVVFANWFESEKHSEEQHPKIDHSEQSPQSGTGGALYR